MKYFATIKVNDGSFSTMFKTQEEAETWLDAQNNNYEHASTVTIYNDNWEETDSYAYTKE